MYGMNVAIHTKRIKSKNGRNGRGTFAANRGAKQHGDFMAQVYMHKRVLRKIRALIKRV